MACKSLWICAWGWLLHFRTCGRGGNWSWCGAGAAGCADWTPSGSGSAPPQAEGVLQGAEVSSSVPVLPNSCTSLCAESYKSSTKSCLRQERRFWRTGRFLLRLSRGVLRWAKQTLGWSTQMVPGHVQGQARQGGSHRNLQNSLCWGIVTGSGWNLKVPLERKSKKETEASPEDCEFLLTTEESLEMWASWGAGCAKWQTDACVMEKASWPFWKKASFCSRKASVQWKNDGRA